MPRSLGGLGHPPSRVGGQGLQIAPGALGVQDAQGQRGLPGTGYPGDGDDLIEGNIHVDIFQVVDPRPTYFYDFWHRCLLLGILARMLFLHIQPAGSLKHCQYNTYPSTIARPYRKLSQRLRRGLSWN